MLSKMNALFRKKTLVPAEFLEEMRVWINEDVQRILSYDAQHKEALKELMLLSQYLHEQTQDVDYLYSYAMAALDLAFIDALEQSRTDDVYTYTYYMCDKAFEAFQSLWEADPCEWTFQRVLEGMNLCRIGQSYQYGDEPRVDIEFERALQTFLHALPKHFQNRLEVRRMLAASYENVIRYHQEMEDLDLLDVEELRLASEERRYMLAKTLEILKGIWEETLDEKDEWRFKEAQRQITETVEQKQAKRQRLSCAPAPIAEQIDEQPERYLPIPVLMDASMSMADAFGDRAKDQRKRWEPLRCAAEELCRMLEETPEGIDSIFLGESIFAEDHCDEERDLAYRKEYDPLEGKPTTCSQEDHIDLKYEVQSMAENAAEEIDERGDEWDECIREIAEGDLTRRKESADSSSSADIFEEFFDFEKKEREHEEVGIREVQFSAVAPKSFVKGEYAMVHLVMYENLFREEVEHLLRESETPQQETKSGILKAKTGSSIRIRLSSPNIAIEDNEETGIWQGKYLCFEFAVEIPENFQKRQILFIATVFINDVIASKLKFTAKCHAADEQNMTIVREDVLSAFVSYASQDRARVISVVQGMKKARPDMDVFFDIESLRSGENWEESLRTNIEKRDIFFLCWSRAARQSKWVDFEWRHALNTKGIEGIEPIPFDMPDLCPPPEELKGKHFGDKLIYIRDYTERSSGVDS